MQPSLCESCAFVREIATPRGSRFLLCELSLRDDSYPKYPSQPRLTCPGYRPREAASTLLFVYGTLKRGQRNHRLLDGQEFVRAARTRPGYRLLDLGPYPGLVESDTGGAIEGEIYRVDAATLLRLDAFEGPQYRRAVIKVQDAGDTVEGYLYQGASDGLCDCGPSWPPESTSPL
jgi:gamma-glutamylcyclotransferase (GGCT)/AIG2-like uncharacterized protein YtfP